MRQAELAQQLESQGVAVEPLLAQRDAIIEQRRRFAEAGVVALDGATVQLSGYLLPVGWQGERVAVGMHDRGALWRQCFPKPSSSAVHTKEAFLSFAGHAVVKSF